MIREVKKDVSLSNNKSKKGIINATPTASKIEELNKKIKCPYYMGVNKDGKKSFPYIRFYDSKIAMMVSLYGNVNEYLDSIKVKK